MRVDDRPLLLQRDPRYPLPPAAPGSREPSADAGERAADVRRDDEVLMVHFGQSLQHLGHWRIVNHQRNRFIIAGGGGHRQRQQQKQQAYPSHHVVSLHVASATLAVHIPKT